MTAPKTPKQRGDADPRPLLANGGRRGKLRADGTAAAPGEKWVRADFERAIREAHGVMSDAATILGCSRAYIYQAVSHRFPDLWATIEEERGAIAEQALLAVQRFAFDPENPDLQACKEILKYFGKYVRMTPKVDVEYASSAAKDERPPWLVDADADDEPNSHDDAEGDGATTH